MADITPYIVGLGAIVVFMILLYIKNYTVVKPYEAHVISGGKVPKVFDGSGKYVLIPFIRQRLILSKRVIEIAVPQIHLHDKDYLPFAVEISCKVQIHDPKRASEALGKATAGEIKPIVDDTIQSAARSQAMLHELKTIMRERDTIEEAIYTSTTDSLARLGIRVVLFDIKNIIDVADSHVINDLERVRSSEINKIARIAESNEQSAAEIHEAEKLSEAEIRKQEAFRRSEEARYKQEQFIAEQRRELTLKEMAILEADTKRKQEIEKERIIIESEALAEKLRLEANARAEARIIDSKAEAEAIRLKAAADADTIRLKLEAEAEGTLKLAEALKKFNDAGISVKLAEINAEASIKMSENIARGIQNNSKLFLPLSGSGNPLLNLIPNIESMKEAGVNLGDLIKTETKK